MSVGARSEREFDEHSAHVDDHDFDASSTLSSRSARPSPAVLADESAIAL
jgi:hypothetical protein